MTRNLLSQPAGKYILAAVVLLVLLSSPVMGRAEVASAHPLGNFTINRYTRIELHPDQIYLKYVLDMAEIPTFQERDHIDLDQNGQIDAQEESTYLASQADLLKNAMSLTIDDSPIPLEIVDRELSFPPGQGGLPTLRFSMLLRKATDQDRYGDELNLHYQDHNFVQRLGWKEIVVRAEPGVSLVNSTAPQKDRSDELRAYPEDLLGKPPELSEAHLTFVVDGDSVPAATFGIAGDSAAPETAPGSGLTALITAQELSLPVIMLALLLSVGLGAAHALTPGHGKTIMAAYLVGTRGTARHALILGFTVTISHTLGVLGLGLVTLYFSSIISPEYLYPWLGLVSGVTVVGIGIWLLTDRLRNRNKVRQHEHGHTHNHDHSGHHHFDASGDTRGLGWKNLAALGTANGLIPSASALIILLAAISLHRIGFGLILILAFSAGMAIVLSGIGIILVYFGRIIEQFRVDSPWSKTLFRLLPVGAGLVVLVSGLVVAFRSVLQVGSLY